MRQTPENLTRIAAQTLAHYEHNAESYWHGTRSHDVRQNIAALLNAIQTAPPFELLDFGCGPGRDLKTFVELGHHATGLEGAAQAVVVRPTLWLAERCARFDDHVLDAGVDAMSRGVVAVARGGAAVDDHGFDRAVEGVAASVRWLGRLARKPQTGQLHQYYIQAVAVLAIGVLLLITVR